MKKLIFLLLITVASYGQTYPNPTFGTITTKTAPTSATDPYVGTVNANGVIGKVAPENIPMNVIPPTTHYTPTTPTLKGHFQGLDNAIGNIPLTTAGNITRIWFTGDATTITAGTFYLTNPTNKGTVANVSQSVINNDNQKKYFTQDLIGQPFATATLFPPGVYAGNLSASTTPNSAQQRFTVELYKCDTNGTPIASGIAGAPVGDLGVTVILILDSGLLTLADGSVTNVPVSASLASQLTIAVGERIRYHVSAEKVGTASSNITESVWYGSSFNSFLDVPTPITSSGVSNVSTVTGATVTNALDNLNIADSQLAGAGVTYGHINDDTQSIAGSKTFTSLLNQQNGTNSNIQIGNGNIAFTTSAIAALGAYPLILRGTGGSSDHLGFRSATSAGSSFFNFSAISTARTFTFQDQSGTFALTNNPTSITAASFIKSGATSGNILLAGGGDIAQSTFQPAGNYAPASGSANYIQASPASAQSANMWISGNGIFGGNVVINTTDNGVDKLQVNGSFSISGDIFMSPGKFIGISPGVGIYIDDNVQGLKIVHPGGFRIETANTAITSLAGSGTRTVVADASGNLSATATPPARPYLVYTALISQSGTSAPTATVLENTLGFTPTFSYDAVGQYGVNSSSGFTSNKTALYLSDGFYNGMKASVRWSTSSKILLYSTNTSGAFADNNGYNGNTLEIRVYP